MLLEILMPTNLRITERGSGSYRILSILHVCLVLFLASLDRQASISRDH
jgi:hypothetical protein